MSRPQSVNTVDTPVHDLASSPPNPSDASQTDPVLSPPNQPRRSLSTHLSPDYHSWVTDVSSPSQGPTSSSPAVPTVPSASRFLDAVTGRSKAQQGRIRRENQPSFNGSTFTNSDNEASREHDSEYGNNNDNNDNDDEDANDNGDDSSKDNKDIVQQQDPILPTRSSNGRSSRGYGATNTSSQDPSLSTTVAPLSSNYGFNDTTDAASTPRLPPLSQSRVQVPDRTRPAYKMGAPITTKQRPNKQRTPSTSPTSEPDHDRADQPTETSALLGGGGRDNQNRTRNPQGDREERWTNEGSRRRVARYDGANQQGILDQYMTDENGMDSLRRPSRARSLSPTMESRRDNRIAGKVAFENYPHGSHRSRSQSRPFHNLRRSSMANINRVRDKLLPRRSMFYDDAKEALVKENNGIRVWYHNYTTIDWIHDFVKERVRLRHLRSIGGIRGVIKNRADGLKGWILVLLTGLITACLAAFIDVFSWWLGDLRMGYCTTNFWWSQYFCCWNSKNSAGTCPEWVSWSKALAPGELNMRVSNDTFDWIIYCLFGVLFAGVCVVMVTSDGTVSQQRSHGATKRRSVPNNGGFVSSAHRNSVQSILDASQPKKIAYFGAGSGIPEVKTILGGFVIRGFLGFRTLMIKLIGLPLMVASGLNMGKQGPLVHIACCVANIVCRIFDKYNRNDGKRREILSAAAASGVAVAFGAPIGGVLFSLEEVSYYFPSKTMWRTYFCALTSAVVLKMINPYRIGKAVLFQVTYNRDWHLFEAVPFFFISVFGGVYGALFSQFHMSYSRFRSRTYIGRHPVQEVLVVALITCAVQWLNPWTRVNLLQLLTNLYSECTADNHLNGMCAVEIEQIYPIFLLLAQVFVMKVVLNFITFGVKVPGGIFIPTMVAGAVFGRMVGLGVQWLIAKYPEHQVFQVCNGDSMDCIIPGLYAMIGAAACLSGVTRMTVSLVVIMFELTGAMTYSLPIMMAVMIGKFVGDAFSPDAFFNKLIALNEHPYLDNKKDYNTCGSAADIADRFVETIDVNVVNDVASLRRKVEFLAASGYSDGGLAIVDRGLLVGYIASNELGHALDLAEEKHPECICIFRNRASSNVPAAEIITSLTDLEARSGSGSTSPLSSKSQSQDWRQDRQIHPSYDDSSFDNDMQGHDRPIRPGNLASSGRFYSRSKDSLEQILRSDSKSLLGSRTDSGLSAEYLADGESDRPHLDARRDRIGSTGTVALLSDPAHTMDFTPFTDQAPLAVSLFSSMDLVMELFIKLGIKYVCVVKAGQLYGMIHKKRLLAFLKENDDKQMRYNRGECF